MCDQTFVDPPATALLGGPAFQTNVFRKNSARSSFLMQLICVKKKLFFYQDLVATTGVPDLPIAGGNIGQNNLKHPKKKKKNYSYSHSHKHLLIYSLVLQKW